MPTAIERKEASEWLDGQGYSIEIIDRPAQRVQWYRRDGLPLPNLLPADNYHLKLYRAKGWTLRPPVAVKDGQPLEAGMPVRPAPVKRKKRKVLAKKRRVAR